MKENLKMGLLPFETWSPFLLIFSQAPPLVLFSLFLYFSSSFAFFCNSIALISRCVSSFLLLSIFFFSLSLKSFKTLSLNSFSLQNNSFSLLIKSTHFLDFSHLPFQLLVSLKRWNKFSSYACPQLIQSLMDNVLPLLTLYCLCCHHSYACPMNLEAHKLTIWYLLHFTMNGCSLSTFFS